MTTKLQDARDFPVEIQEQSIVFTNLDEVVPRFQNSVFGRGDSLEGSFNKDTPMLPSKASKYEKQFSFE